MFRLGEVVVERMLFRPRPGDDPLGVAGMEVPITQPGWIIEPRTEPIACSGVITGPSVPVSESAREVDHRRPIHGDGQPCADVVRG